VSGLSRDARGFVRAVWRFAVEVFTTS
jgi:hypothetical protein